MLPSAPSRLVPGREANTDLLCIQITDREWTGAPVPFVGDAPYSSPELAAASFSSTPPNNGARHRRRALSKKALAVCRAFRRRYPRPSSRPASRPPLPRSPDGPRPQRRSPTLRFPSPRTSGRGRGFLPPAPRPSSRPSSSPGSSPPSPGPPTRGRLSSLGWSFVRGAAFTDCCAPPRGS